MDYESMTYPIGMAAALNASRNVSAEQENMTEAEKEHLILQYKDAQSKEEKDRLLNALPKEDINDLFDGPGIG